MTDAQKLLLCATLMGLKVFNDEESRFVVIRNAAAAEFYDPLTDNAQATALVERLIETPELKRAIVDCAAELVRLNKVPLP